jgi:hypothetical protein
MKMAQPCKADSPGCLKTGPSMFMTAGDAGFNLTRIPRSLNIFMTDCENPENPGRIRGESGENPEENPGTHNCPQSPKPATPVG